MKKLTVWILLLMTVAVFSANFTDNGKNYTQEQMVKLWKNRTAGKNLALGKPVMFAPSPDYHLTVKGNSDANDLTDGKLTGDSNQAIWFEENAVGWMIGGYKNIIIDLGEEHNVGKVVWRVVAGCKAKEFTGPRHIQIFGSLDGVNATLLAQSYRWSDDLAAAESYKLPNIGDFATGDKTYVYPIEIKVDNYKTRYIVLRFEQDSVWFTSDELAVITGDGNGKSIRDLPMQQLQTSDLWINAPEKSLPIVPGVDLPTYFNQVDCRDNGATLGAEYHFILPENVEIEIPTLSLKNRDGNHVVYHSPAGGNKLIGPVFFRTDELKEPAGVVIYAAGANSKEQPRYELTLIPETLPNKSGFDPNLVLGIAWMTDSERQLWPNFMTAMKQLGFNLVPTFPSAWISGPIWKGEMSESELRKAANPAELTEYGRQLEQMRNEKMKILMVYSPLHIINWSFPAERSAYQCGNYALGGTYDEFCMSNMGAFYQKEIESVANAFEGAGGADYVMWDCELLGTSLSAGMNCPSCQAAFKASGEKNFEAWFKAQTKRLFADLEKSIRQVATRRNWKQPEIGLYAVNAAQSYEHGLIFADLAESLDFQNPSLYVGDHPESINSLVRSMREVSGKNDIFPWATTNTYGYVSPVNCKIMVWENFLNGAFGVGYYEVKDFNPAQYLAVAEAFHALRPYSELIRNGVPAHAEFTVTSGKARLSAVRNGKKILLLAVNPDRETQRITYKHQSGKTGTVTLPPQNGALIDINLD